MTEFRPAERRAAKPLIGLYAESGCGKTYGALLIARGFVGPAGRIGMIETESGRGEAFSDPKEYPEFARDRGGANYDVLSLRDDFSPKNYGDAISAAEKATLDALIIDSGSHEWEGPGGVLSMAAANEVSGMKGVLVWQRPKLSHARDFMLRLLQTPIPLVILCMRAKYPMEQKLVNGRKDWARSETLEPKQSEDILYEMFVHGWVDQRHNFHLTKTTSRALEPVFANDKPLTIRTGQELAMWAKGEVPGRTEFKNTQPDTETLKAEGQEAAEGGVAILQKWWLARSTAEKKALETYKDEVLKPIAVEADKEPTEDNAI